MYPEDLMINAGGNEDVEHTHADGTTHSHPGGDQEHTHDEEPAK